MINEWGLVVSLNRRTEMKGGELEGDGGVIHEESSFCGKNLLSLHMVHGEDDKNSYSHKKRE